MARYTTPELDKIVKHPSESTGWDWSNLDPSQEETSLAWIQNTQGLGDIGASIAHNAVDRAGLIGQFGLASLWRSIGSCPGVGLQESRIGVISGLSEWSDQNFTLPTQGGPEGASWFGALSEISGVGNVADCVGFNGENITFDPNLLVRGLAGAAYEQFSSAVMAATSSIPVVGMFVNAALRIGTAVARARLRMNADQRAAEDRATWAGSSGLCGLSTAGIGGQASWLSTADRIVAQEIVNQITPSSQDLAQYQGQGFGGDDVAESAGDVDLTYALLPHQIPSGQYGPGVNQEGDYAIGNQDQDCTGSQGGRAVFSGRLIGSMRGSGYLPGLGFVGRPVFTATHGRYQSGLIPSLYKYDKWAWYSASLFDRGDLGEVLGASSTLCQGIEAMVMKSPMCFQIDVDRLESEWRQAIEGWTELTERIAYDRTKINGLPAKSMTGEHLWGRHGMTPAPWLNCSQVWLRTASGGLVRSVRPGPNLYPWGGQTTSVKSWAENCDESQEMPWFAYSPVELGWMHDMQGRILGRPGRGFDLWTASSKNENHRPDRMVAGEWNVFHEPGMRCNVFDQQCGDRLSGDSVGIPMWQPTKYRNDERDAEWGGKLKTWIWFDDDSCGGPGMRYGKHKKPWRMANPPQIKGRIPVYDFDGYRAWYEQARERNPWPSSDAPIVWLDPSRTFSASGTKLIKTQNVYDLVIKPFIKRIKDRQLAALDTLQCAYVSHRAPAFRSGAWASVLTVKLKERRAQLLSHEARFQVHMADVNDNVGAPSITGNFAQMLKEAGSMGVGSLGPGTSEEPDLSGGTVEFYSPQDPPEPQPEPGDMPAPMPTDEPADDSAESVPDTDEPPQVAPGLLGVGALALGIAILSKR